MTVTDLPDSPVLEPGDSPQHLMARDFARIRAERRARGIVPPRPRAGLRSLGRRRRRGQHALVTMVHDEAVFLPLFLRYYGQFYDAQDIYVLDNETTDGSTDGPGFVRIDAPHAEVDHTWMVRRQEELQHELLGSYADVLVVDVDELVVPNPVNGTLGDYLDAFTQPWVNCLGYELLHLPDEEPPLDLTRPILEQRGHWYFNGAYDKAALASEPMRWRPGFHGREDYQYDLDPDLRLVHLHRMDRDLCLERHRRRGNKPWAAEDAERGWAAHNRIVDEAAFDRWFSGDSSFEGFGGSSYTMLIERIPALWREAF